MSVCNYIGGWQNLGEAAAELVEARAGDFEKGAIIFGVFTAGIGDDILQTGSRMSRYADELGEGAEFAAKHADELEDAVQIATRNSDELLEAAAWSARYGDDVTDSQRLARRLDDYATRTDPTIQRRMDDWVVRSDNGLSRVHDNDISYSAINELSNPNFKANNTSDSIALNKRIYDKLSETPTGEYILEQVDKIGERPLILFDNELLGSRRAGSYYPRENLIKLNPELQEVPEASVQAIVAHELTHRIGRQMDNSIADEVQAHFIEGWVWQELGGPKVARSLDRSNLSDFQGEILTSQEKISQIKNVDAMQKYIYKVSNEYRSLPEYSVTNVESIQNKIQRVQNNRDFLAQHGHLNAFANDLRDLQKDLKFWESFEE